MSNRARRKYLFRQRLRAGVHAGTLPNDLESLGDVRHAFRAIRRPPLRMPNLESMDNLGDIQSRNSRPDDDFDLLDDDLKLLHEDLHDFIGWEDYMEAIEKTSRAFYSARDILEPLRRVSRWKFNWRDPSGWDDGYLDEVVDYIAPIRQASREIWHKAYSITKQLRGDDERRLASWWLPSTSDHRRGRWPVWPPLDLPPGRVPDYAALAIVAMHEAHLASTTFQKIVRALDEEAKRAGIDPEDDKAVASLRERLARFERGEARFAYSILDEAKDYLTAARLAIAQELGAEELQRQVEKARAQANTIDRRKRDALIRELEHRWPTLADDMRRYEPWIRAAKLPGQHGYWDRSAILRIGKEKGILPDEVEPELPPLEAFNRRNRTP